MKDGKTLYEMWIQQDVPVKLHESTILIFQAYKLGTSGHILPLRNSFPEYFTDPWTIGINQL